MSTATFFSQSLKPYTIVYVVDKIIDKGEYVNDEKVNKKEFIYKCNAKKDSLAYYDFYNSKITEQNTPSLYTLTKNKNVLSLHCKGSYENTVKLIFNNERKAIVINSKDIFYLNDDYYKYLYKSVNQNLSIPDLIDLLEDFLQDYNLDEIKYISSNTKYKNKNFRVIKAYMESYRSQAPDYLDKWNVKFIYDKRGVLSSLLKESIEGDQALEKKIISYKDNMFKYSIHRNNESRLITDSEELFNIKTNSYNEKITSTQIGLGKETKYDIERITYKIFSSNQLYLNSKDILEITSSK